MSFPSGSDQHVQFLDALVQASLSQGPLPASEVMALALYHPQYGYYRRAAGPWGFEGKDYYTALDLGPLLGQTLAIRLHAVWERLGRPQEFTVLEAGAGRGWLGRDLLSAAQGDFAAALRYLHRDDNPAARSAAEEALRPWLEGGKAQFLRETDPIPPFAGAVVSNELFDALPAQPWRWDGSGWCREVLARDGPEWQAADPGEAGAWFQAESDGLEPGDGSVWCDVLPAVVHQLAAPLARGLFLAIDYGDHASRLLAKGADLRRFRQHAVDGKWHEDLGQSDLTADVDFTRLQRCLEAEGFIAAEHVDLSRWIRAHAPLMDWEQGWMELPPADRMKRMENLLQLTLPGKMGERFRVLEGWRG